MIPLLTPNVRLALKELSSVLPIVTTNYV